MRGITHIGGGEKSPSPTFDIRRRIMKKKNRFKSWLIKVLRNWLSKLEPYHNVVKVEHVHVPLLTLDASVDMPKSRPLPEDRINEILAKRLSEEVIKYADIEYYEKVDMSMWEEQIVYRATVRIAADKRG
jgi:hypothetical protein